MNRLFLTLGVWLVFFISPTQFPQRKSQTIRPLAVLALCCGREPPMRIQKRVER
jgi:hypothetical protein